jgi:AcrR family transcriptional regulator
MPGAKAPPSKSASGPAASRILRKAPAQARSANTIDAIVEGAARILERSGFADYTTNKIAERAGVSVGSLYQYFPHKDAITQALIEREAATLVQEVKLALASGTPSEALRAVSEAAVRQQFRRPKLAGLLDLEEERLGGDAPGRTQAALSVQIALAEHLETAYGLSKPMAATSAADIMDITRTLTDSAGLRLDIGAAHLERIIEGAILGYLSVVLETGKPAPDPLSSGP